MHLTDRTTLFGLPLNGLTASFLINVLIFIPEPDHAHSTGGVSALCVFSLVAVVAVAARGMAFALSMGASRHAFALGTGAVGAIFAVGFGTLLLILNRAEAATGGWWLHGHLFTFGWLDRHGVATTWLLAVVLLLSTFLAGAATSTVWLRWKPWPVRRVARGGRKELGRGRIGRRPAAGQASHMFRHRPIFVEGA